MKPLTFTFVLCLFAGLAGCTGQTGSPPAKKVDQELPAKEVAKEIDLKEVDLAHFLDEIKEQKGKVVVVDFWATWCPPCIRAFPHVVEMHHKYHAQNVVCMSVSFDDLEEKPRALKFLRDKKAAFANYIVGEKKDAFQTHWDFSSIPSVAVYDTTGKLARRFTVDEDGKGAFTYDDVEHFVQTLIKK